MTVERGARLFKGRGGWLDPVVGNFWPSCRLFSIALPHCNVLQIIWTCVRGLTHWEKPPQYYFLKKVLRQKHISDAGTVGGCTPDWSSAHSLPLAGAIILPSMPPMQSIQLNPPPPLISWINIRFASPVSLTYCWYPCWKLPDKRTCDAASCMGSTFQAVGHPWPPSSSLVDNSLLPPHWRKLHSLPHISHCWKVEPTSSSTSQSPIFLHCPHDHIANHDDHQGRSRCLPLLASPHQRLVLWKTWPHSAPGHNHYHHYDEDFDDESDFGESFILLHAALTDGGIPPGVPAHSPKTPKQGLPSLWGPGLFIIHH